jgi:hypothetical protein
MKLLKVAFARESMSLFAVQNDTIQLILQLVVAVILPFPRGLMLPCDELVACIVQKAQEGDLQWVQVQHS